MLDLTKNPPLSEDEKAAIEAEAYFASLRALEEAERLSGMSRSAISGRSGIAKSTVSRVLNGSAKNITLYTLFLLSRAMGFKINIEPLELKAAHLRASNFDFMPASPNFEQHDNYIRIGIDSMTSATVSLPIEEPAL